MSRFILHTKTKEKKYFTYLAAGITSILLIAAGCCALRGIGTARAKSREMVLIYTEEEENQMRPPLTVMDGQYLVLGDNRKVSIDSRDSGMGTVPAESMLGKVILIIRGRG